MEARSRGIGFQPMALVLSREAAVAAALLKTKTTNGTPVLLDDHRLEADATERWKLTTDHQQLSQMTPDDPHIPSPLAEKLRRAFAHRVRVPGEVDRAILNQARAKFAGRSRLRLWAWGTGIAAAVAACIVLGVLLVPRQADRELAWKLEPGHAIDMVDAMRLASQLKQGKTVDSSWDLNHDGRVDQADVEAVARAAVSLKSPSAAMPVDETTDRAHAERLKTDLYAMAAGRRDEEVTP